jgi:hypothetical protein
MVALAACHHDWDPLDPRLGASTSTGSGGALATSSSSTASSSSGDAGRVDADAEGGAASPYRDAVLADQPIAYFRFEEAEGPTLADETGHHPGTTSTAGLTYGVPGAVPGSALGFDGSNGYATIASPPDFAALAPYTFETWIKLSAPHEVYPRVLSKEVLTAPRQGYNLLASLLPDGGPLDAGQDIGLERYPEGDGGQVAVYRTSGLSSTDWHHLAGRFDGARLTILVDGVAGPSGDPSDAGLVPLPASSLFIGWDGRIGQGHFAGYLDELAIYDKALTDAQIAAHYQAATSVP